MGNIYHHGTVIDRPLSPRFRDGPYVGSYGPRSPAQNNDVTLFLERAPAIDLFCSIVLLRLQVRGDNEKSLRPVFIIGSYFK